MALNLNMGIMGHVDSGKTTLAKRLSEIASTAAFDKDPQSQSRGITLDLGFSCFSIPTPIHLTTETEANKFQYTLVDCPGHASLIRTMIGGAQIIDIILLVIDITKGIQTQTAECLVIGEITCKKMIIVLNKIDLIPVDRRDNFIEKIKRKIKITLTDTVFKDSPIVAVSVNPNSDDIGVSSLIEQIANYSFIPQRESSGPFVFAVDHCFSIKGQGTILTGTVLKGCTSVNEVIEIPAMAVERKIKSIQVFRKPVNQIFQGDRAGICVTQFDSKLFERGVVCSPNLARYIHCGIIALNRIKYFKHPINSRTKFHISIGHETTLGTITLFTTNNSDGFSLEHDYQYVNSLYPIEDESSSNFQYFMLIQFDKAVLATDNALIIGSKLDADTAINSCRIGFWGNLLCFCKDKDYRNAFLSKLRIYKLKSKVGTIERIVSDNVAIVKNMFKKETQLDLFIGLRVNTSFGYNGRIDSTFGKSGKIKIVFEDSLTDEIKDMVEKKSSINKLEVVLNFKKYVYDLNKKIQQYIVISLQLLMNE